jgi:hypothetical protein
MRCAGAAAAAAEEPRAFGRMRIDVVAREVHLDGAPVELTRIEFDLLAALSARPRMAFSRHQLIEAVWGEGWVGDDRRDPVVHDLGAAGGRLAHRNAPPGFIRPSWSTLRRARGGGEGRGSRRHGPSFLPARRIVIAPVFGRVAGVFIAFLIPFIDVGIGQSPMLHGEPAGWAPYPGVEPR